MGFAAEPVEPSSFLEGRVLVTAPHQDDEVLACGATLARLRDKDVVHVAYATDGSGSPSPLLPWRDPAPEGLDRIRMEEARAAMDRLGVAASNVHFLAFPDGRLRRHVPALRAALEKLAATTRPDHVLVPFRFDRHPDHLALNLAVLTALAGGGLGDARVTEYFVYWQWRLLPRGDVRAYVRPGLLRRVDPDERAARAKREALERFRSQTTRFYDWQTRPNLTPELCDEVSAAPELFLRYDPALPGGSVLTGSRGWIRLAHRLEPALKKRKDQLVALLRRGTGRARA